MKMITSTLLMTRLEKISSKNNSELAKASTSILKLPVGSGVTVSPGHLVVRLNGGLRCGRTEAATFRKTVSNLPTEVENYFTIWLFASSSKILREHSLKCFFKNRSRVDLGVLKSVAFTH